MCSACRHAVAAMFGNGHVVAWGSPACGSDSNAILRAVRLPSRLQSLAFGFGFEFNQSSQPVNIDLFQRRLQSDSSVVAVPFRVTRWLRCWTMNQWWPDAILPYLATFGYHFFLQLGSSDATQPAASSRAWRMQRTLSLRRCTWSFEDSPITERCAAHPRD